MDNGTAPANTPKLPVKRKHPYESPNPNRNRFHRVWTEPDELLFLRSLISTAASLRLSFPRDLPVFYSHFLSSPAASSLSHPYSKSQLYEKLRRLRKKFRSLSLRLDRGILDVSSLPLHDRELFNLSRRLWSPQFASSSPFFSSSTSAAADCLNDDDNYNCNGSRGNSACGKSDDDRAGELDGDGDGNEGDDFDLKEVCVGYDFGKDHNTDPLKGSSSSVGGNRHGDRNRDCCLIGELVARTATEVLDRSLQEVRMAVERGGNDAIISEKECGKRGSRTSSISSDKKSREEDLSMRWKEQILTELDVFGRRLKLLLEDSIAQKWRICGWKGSFSKPKNS